MQQRRRRSGLIIGLLALGLLAGVALTAPPAQAADSSIDPDVSSPVPLAAGLGPYYALPAWDRKMAPVNRFVVLTDWGASAAVLDKETGLVWERSPLTGISIWIQARAGCLGRTTGDRKGWRLPSFPELASLVDPSVSPGPTLPAGHPFLTVESANYWSATTNAVFPTSAWYLDFSLGNVGDVGDKSVTIRAWCVRGGMNADVY